MSIQAAKLMAFAVALTIALGLGVAAMTMFKKPCCPETEACCPAAEQCADCPDAEVNEESGNV